MGSNLARQAIDKGLRVVGLTRTGVDDELLSAGVVEAKEPADLRRLLSGPRCVFLHIPAGPAVDKLVAEVSAQLEPGDIIVDGATRIGVTRSADTSA